MHKIYFEKRCIVICDPGDEALSDPNAVEFHLEDRMDIRALVGLFETSATLQKVYVPDADSTQTYKKLCAQFKEVNAAGGLVCNRRGDYLLIRRNGLWDLPKGHQENGEDITVTALREVEEETGIGNIQIVKELPSTWHCYLEHEEWKLKRTYWYLMSTSGRILPNPQTEEGISEIRLIGNEDIETFLKNTFRSLGEILEKELRQVVAK